MVHYSPSFEPCAYWSRLSNKKRISCRANEVFLSMLNVSLPVDNRIVELNLFNSTVFAR